jgi:hypothetical protein
MRSSCKKTPVIRDGIIIIIIIIIIISGALPVAKEPKYLSICSDQTMDRTVYGSKPRREKRFSLLQNGQTGPEATLPHFQWVPSFFPGGKAPEFKNGWSYTSVSHMPSVR